MSRGNKPYVVIDTETDGISFTKLFCVGFAEEDGSTSHTVLNWDLFNEDEELQDYTEDPNFQALQHKLDISYCIFHNAVYDISVLTAFGFSFTNVEFDDTMMLSYLDYPLRPTGHSLKAWGEELGEQKLEHKDFTHYTPEMGLYCEQDCLVTMKLHQHLIQQLNKDKKAFNLYEKVDKPAILATVILQTNGIKIDTETWNKQTEELEHVQAKELDYLRSIVPYAPGAASKVKTERRPEFTIQPTTLRDLEDSNGKYYPVGQDDSGLYTYKKFVPFTPNSNNQIIWVLEKFYDWKPTELTPNGNPRCDADVLGDIGNTFTESLCRYATYAKLTGTYGKSFTDAVRSDGRVHANFNPCVTATGRYSSSNPNLQNIPKSGETGSTIRKSFVSSDGCSFIGIDCSNFQIRILANYLAEYGKTEDSKAFAKEFNTKEKADPHQVTADLLGVDRTTGKTLNFSVIFGLGAVNLSKRLHIDEYEGRKLFRKMKEFFPSLPALKEKIWDACRNSGGIVHDLYGRRGYYPGISSSDKQEVARAERQVFNFVIQATEATIMKMMMLAGIVAGQQYGANLVLQVHDELLFEVPDGNVEPFKFELESIFSQPYLPLVKMKGDAKVGKNWEQSH